MLKFLGIILLIGIIFAIVKYFLVFIIRITATGIVAFFTVGAITGLLTLFDVISSDTAWIISGIAFFLGFAYNLYEFFSSPSEVMSDVNRMYREKSNYSSASTQSSEEGEIDQYSFPCCGNCQWNQDRGCHYVRCFQDGNDDRECNDRCSKWQHF